MGFSRDTFYRYQAAVETDGVDALIDASRRKPTQHQEPHRRGEAAVTAFALGAACFWSSSGFQRTAQMRNLRLFIRCPFGVAAPESVVVQKASIRLGKAYRRNREGVNRDTGTGAGEETRRWCSHDEIETAHPEYFCSQIPSTSVLLRVCGGFISRLSSDNYSKWAATKLYTTKIPITVADLLNDRMLSFFAEQSMCVISIP